MIRMPRFPILLTLALLAAAQPRSLDAREKAVSAGSPSVRSLSLRASARFSPVREASARRIQARMIGLISRIALLRAELAEIDGELARSSEERAKKELESRKRTALSRLSGLTGRLVAAKRALRAGGKR